MRADAANVDCDRHKTDTIRQASNRFNIVWMLMTVSFYRADRAVRQWAKINAMGTPPTSYLSIQTCPQFNDLIRPFCPEQVRCFPKPSGLTPHFLSHGTRLGFTLLKVRSLKVQDLSNLPPRSFLQNGGFKLDGHVFGNTQTSC